MKTVIDGGDHIGWANALSAQHLRRMLADKALAQPTRWSVFKNAGLHAIVLVKR